MFPLVIGFFPEHHVCENFSRFFYLVLVYLSPCHCYYFTIYLYILLLIDFWVIFSLGLL